MRRFAEAFAPRAGILAAVVGFSAAAIFAIQARPVRAANLYAQYGSGTPLPGGGFAGMESAYGVGEGGVQYVQVSLDIENDEQRGASYYCPVAPNTGVLIFIYHNGADVYRHCITSAEAAGKLGRAAVYTFDDAGGFGYPNGGGSWAASFSSQGSMPADPYGAPAPGGGFDAYLVLADSGGPASPAAVGELAQYSGDSFASGDPTLPENGNADGDTMVFAGTPVSFFASDTVAFEVEVKPFSMPFDGTPTAASDAGPSGATTSVKVAHLAPGAYHWAARAADAVKGYRSPWVEYRAAGNADFNIPTSSTRNALVIVPGIMGSRLDRGAGGDEGGKEVWPDAEDMIVSSTDRYLDYLKLYQNGAPSPERPVVAPDILREATATFLGIPFSGVFYKNLMDAFLSDGYAEGKNLFAAPYDWRLGAESSSAAIAEKISEAASSSPTGKVDIIAHSFGGLLLKKYLSGLDSTSSKKIGKVVLAGVPQLGAPKAWKLLNYGDDLGLNWLGFGLSAKKAKEISANMPSIYELLPSRRYADVAGGYIRDFRSGAGGAPLSYDSTTVPNTGLFAAADAFHGGLDPAGLDLNPVNASGVFNIVGCGEPTPSEFELYDKGVTDVSRTAGDGTVPEASAMDLADGYHNYFILGGATGVSHAGLVADPVPLALIRGIIDGAKPPALSSLPKGISKSLTACFGDGAGGDPAAAATTIEFAAHGAASLDVYDASGGHAGGGGASETTTAGIPGSDFEEIGDNAFVTLPPPSSGAYRVVAVPAPDATGTFEMRIREYSGGVPVRAATYAAIPVAGASTTAELDFSGFDGDMGLKVDAGSGGGAGEAALAPDAVLSTPSSTADVTPPELALPDFPTGAVFGETSTLSFSASDAESGIATTSAALNGVPVAPGATVAFTSPGLNIFTLTAVNGAGIPRTEEADFTVASPSARICAAPHGTI